MVSVGLTLLTIPMGIMSYAWRGTLEEETTHAVTGGNDTSNEYKAATILIMCLAIAIALVYFVSKPGWAKH